MGSGASMPPVDALAAPTDDNLRIEWSRHFKAGCHAAETGMFISAIPKFETALAIACCLEEKEWESRCLRGLGQACLVGSAQLEKAIEHYLQALQISWEIKDRPGEAHCLRELGIAYNILGQGGKAIEHQLKALEISRETKDKQGEGTDLGNIANAYSLMRQYDKAIEHHLQSLEIRRELKDRHGEGQNLGNLGIAYNDLGQYNKAMEHSFQALDIRREIKDRRGEMLDLNTLGNIYQNLGQYDKAVEHQLQALQITLEIKDWQIEGACLSSLGNAYIFLGQVDKAVKHYAKSLDISRKIKDRQGEGVCLGSLGNSYKRLGQHDKAIEHYLKALEVSLGIEDRLGEVTALSNLGHTYRELEQYAEAITFCEECLSVMDSMWQDLGSDDRRIAFVDRLDQGVSRTLQHAHVALGEELLALECAERAHARAFEFLLMQQRVGSIERCVPLTFANAECVVDGQAATVIIFSQITDKLIFVWVFNSARGSCIFKKLQLETSDFSLAQLVELTRRAVGTEPRRNSEKDRLPPHFEELTQQINEEQLARARQTDEEAACLESLRHCYNVLIKPLADALPEEGQLLIVPDQELFALPFAALLDEDGRHLIERYSIRLVPSIGTVAELQRNRQLRARSQTEGCMPSKTSALIVGNPSFNGCLPSLAGAEQEAKCVKQILEARFNATLLLGDAASQSMAVPVMQESEIVHLATHGAPDGVYFAGENLEDCKLSMSRVQNLRLTKAELLVLSECDSFRGELRTDGVIGITRSFMAAGVTTLIASLWSVQDKETSMLMQRFYSRFLQGQGVSAAEALRGAMVSMISAGIFTVDEWAPFVVYGLDLQLKDPLPSVDCHSFPNDSAGLRQELLDLLGPRSSDSVADALEWCLSHGPKSVLDITATGKQSEFVSSLKLKRVPAKILLNDLTSLTQPREVAVRRTRAPISSVSNLAALLEQLDAHDRMKTAEEWCLDAGADTLKDIYEAALEDEFLNMLQLDPAKAPMLLDLIQGRSLQLHSTPENKMQPAHVAREDDDDDDKALLAAAIALSLGSPPS